MKEGLAIAGAIAFALAVWTVIIYVKVVAWHQCRAGNEFLFCLVAIGGR